jgi:hypothetical protein
LSSERISIWVPVSKREYIKDYHDTLARNGTNLTQEFWKNVDLYMERHYNESQTSIDSFSDKGSQSLALVEKQIKDVFLAFPEHRSIQWNDIIIQCRDKIPETSKALAVARRIEKELKEVGRKIWR